MAKIRKFDVLSVPVEVEYKKPVLGCVIVFITWLLLIRVKRFNITMNNKPLYSFYRLIVPRFMKGGEADEE